METEFKSGEEQVAERAHVFWIAGELDLATVPAVSERLLELAASGSQMIVDLEYCTFVDSTALTLLVKTHRELDVNGAGANGAMAVVARSPEVRRVFSIAGLDKTFAVVETRRAALEALGLPSNP